MSKNKLGTPAPKEKIICDRCKKPIEDLCYVKVMGALVLKKYMPQIPPIFKCWEQADNYAKYLILHDDCWIKTLEEHGVKLVSMTELAKKITKQKNKEKKELKKDGVG